MLAHSLHVLLKLSHLILVTQHLHYIVASHNAQFGKKRLDDLQMSVLRPVEHHGINVFQYNVFLCHCCKGTTFTS